MQKIILATASQARIQLFSEFRLPFSSYATSVDETPLEGENARDLVVRLATLKARAAQRINPHALCVGADTVATLQDKIFGKPKDADEARVMLGSLNGKTHVMISGVCVIDGRTGREETGIAQTHVTFKIHSKQDIENYIESGFWRGKAGAYAIQNGMGLVARMQGSLQNVMGLPIALVRDKFEAIGFDWKQGNK